jgi:uncharacterized protein YdhG (YjbR/CyaY superfamily)
VLTVDEAVQDYVDRIAPEHRPLFDRLHRLIMAAHPDATVVLSFRMPTYKVGNRHLFVGVWKHGVSVYGWQWGPDGAFTSGHPELKTSTGTIRLLSEDAAAISDDELSDLVYDALGKPRTAADALGDAAEQGWLNLSFSFDAVSERVVWSPGGTPNGGDGPP